MRAIYFLIFFVLTGLCLTGCASSKETPDLAAFNSEPSLPTGGSDAAMAAAKTY